MKRSCSLSAQLALLCAGLTLAQTQLGAQTAASGPCPSAAVKDHGQVANGKTLASPAATAEAKLNGKTLAIHYNAPSMRCRPIMGDLVPYGKVWRTGANPATSFTTETDLTIGTLHIPAGKYTLYTLPAAPGTPWMLIVNKQTGQWGTEYNEAQDLGRTPMHAEKLSSPQEAMSLSFEKSTAAATQLHIKWERTDEWVEVKACEVTGVAQRKPDAKDAKYRQDSPRLPQRFTNPSRSFASPLRPLRQLYLVCLESVHPSIDAIT